MYSLVGDVDNGGDCVCWDKGVYGKSISSAQFCCEHKTTLKNKVCFKKWREECLGQNLREFSALKNYSWNSSVALCKNN